MLIMWDSLSTMAKDKSLIFLADIFLVFIKLSKATVKEHVRISVTLLRRFCCERKRILLSPFYLAHKTEFNDVDSLQDLYLVRDLMWLRIRNIFY